MGWRGIDLDGTLAVHEFDSSHPTHLGPPVEKMLGRVKEFLSEGWEVKIMTARVASSQPEEQRAAQHSAIRAWCKKHVGVALEATAEKDFNMIDLWDDRAVQIVRDTGVRADGKA